MLGGVEVRLGVTEVGACVIRHVESFVFLLLIIRIAEHHYYREVIAIFMIFLANITMHRYNLF